MSRGPSANLDLLRSIAVLLVLAQHLCRRLNIDQVGWMPTTWGVFGVLLFFVHTCLVSMYSLQRSELTLIESTLRTSFCIWIALGLLASHPLWLRIAVLIVLLVGLPVLLYHAIEKPMIELGIRIAARFTEPRALPGAAAAL